MKKLLAIFLVYIFLCAKLFSAEPNEPVKKIGFDYALFTGLKPTIPLSNYFELVFPVSYAWSKGAGFIRKDILVDWKELYAGAGIRYKFWTDYGWFIEPTLSIGWIKEFEETYLPLKFRGLLGYLWEWDTFRMSLSFGPQYVNKIGDSNNFFQYSPAYLIDEHTTKRTKHAYWPVTGELTLGLAI